MKIFNICKEHRIHSFNLLINYDQYQENSFPVMDKKNLINLIIRPYLSYYLNTISFSLRFFLLLAFLQPFSWQELF